MTTKPPHILNFSPEKIDALIQDLSIEDKGTDIYFVIDPHEIYDFCFPVDPKGMKDYNIDSLADRQITLYEVFNHLKHRPIIFEEYKEELYGLLTLFYGDVRDVYQKSNQIDQILAGVRLDTSASYNDSIISEYKDIPENLNIILAVAMGIYSLGSERFSEVMRSKLYFERESKEIKFLSELLSNYNETRIVESIYSKLAIELDENPLFNKIEKDRRRKSAKHDAQVVDKVIYLDRKILKEISETKANPDHIFLYLSNAPRSRTIFDMEIVKDAFPLYKGKQFNVWRSQDHLLSYILHRRLQENSNGPALDNLRKFKDMLIQVQSEKKERCLSCALVGGSDTSCQVFDTCRKLNEYNDSLMQVKMRIAKSMGLFVTLTNYKELLDKKPEEKYKKIL